MKRIGMQHSACAIAAAIGFCAAALAATPAAACTVKVAASPIGRTMMVGADGGVRGIVPDFLALVAKNTGCTFEYQVWPRVRAMALFRKGDVDLIPASVRTGDRDALGIFIHTYNTRPMLIALDGKLPATIGRQELSGKRYRLAVLRGYDYGPEYQRMVKDQAFKPSLSVITDPDTAARMLAAGRFDAVLVSPSVFLHAADAAGLTNRISVSTVNELPFSPAGMYISSKALNAADRGRLREAIANLTAHGEYARLVKQYHASPKWSAQSIEGVM